MRFAAGLILGGLLTAGGFLLVPDTPPSSPETGTDTSPNEAVEGSPSRADLDVVEAAPLLQGTGLLPEPDAVKEVEPFAAGEIVLAIGSGYTFEETHTTAQTDPSKVDVYCQDIRYGASLACRLGAASALAPMTSVGLPELPIDAAVLVKDAPLDLPQRNLMLATRAQAQATGFGFVRAANGRVYKLALAELTAHPEALQRRVRLVFEEVESRAGGGELHLPSTGSVEPLPLSARTEIRAAGAIGKAIPGGTMVRSILGQYKKLTDVTPDLEIRKEGHYALETPLVDTLTLNARGAVWADAGVAEGGAVHLKRYTAFGTPGDLDGEVTNHSYAYMYVGGDLTGQVHVKSYASVVVLGDVRGTLKVRSYTTLYLRGRVRGRLDCKGSCWSTFYLDGHWTQSELEALGEGFGSVTLHVRSSDLDVGEHEEIGSWRQVIVGDKSWARFDT